MHHVITGRHVALMAVIAACLDVTPDAFEVASCQVGGRPGPTGRLGGNGKGLVWASTYQPTPGCMTTRHILVLREAHIHPWHSPRGTTFLGEVVPPRVPPSAVLGAALSLGFRALPMRYATRM